MTRTRVSSAAVAVPQAAVAVPVLRTQAAPVGPGVPASVARHARPVEVRAAQPVPVSAVPPIPAHSGNGSSAGPAGSADTGARTATLDVGEQVAGIAVRTRPPSDAPPARLRIAAGRAPAAAVMAERARAQGSAGGTGSAPGAAATDRCAEVRRLVDERCAFATAARDNAKLAADTLREAQRAYDTLREQLDRAQAAADPRGIAAAKDELHRAFRAASERAGSADETEAAAREWLHAINELNRAARDAAKLLEAGGAELRAAIPRLERLSVEADAARISAESAEAGCQDARERLASCEEEAARADREAPAAPEDAHPFDALWPGESASTRNQPLDEAPAEAAGEAVILRVIRGDRGARDGLVMALAADDADAVRAWQLRLAELVDAITARAIEDGYLDVPDDNAFWGLFEQGERRDIVGALSALGYRFDGIAGFADGRVPAARDLSLAVGYAGLDRMRIRTWPREADLAALYDGATVAADEWLVDQADDLALGRMVDALGSRASDLAEVWNAWGRLRPALLATD